MTPRRTRQAICVFLLLALAVLYNALFRQVRVTLGSSIATEPALAPAPPVQALPKAASVAAERPAPGKDADKRGPRAPRANPVPHQDWAATDSTGAAGPARSASASPDTIRAIQRELRQRGYGNLASDGTLRPSTRAAIMAYEYDNGLLLTGQASEGLLSRILFGGTPGAEPGGKVGSAEAAELVRHVQQALAGLGYQPGPVDGQLRPETVRAIRDFELDKGSVPKGRISAELLAALAAPAAHKLSRR